MNRYSKEALQAVSELNEDANQGLEFYKPFYYETDGENSIVTFMGLKLWSSIDEPRNWDSAISDFEPIKNFLINEAMIIVEDIVIKFVSINKK
jgi:hypothetical protein